jgi:hypothetical protein
MMSSPPSFLHSRADEAFGETGLGDIAIDRDRLAAQRLDLVDDGFAGARVEVVDDNFGAVAGELQRDASADAASRTGDERDFSCQIVHSDFLFKER